MRDAFTVALAILAVVVLVLTTLIALRQAVHQASARRRLTLERATRPVLFAALDARPGEPSGLGGLGRARRRTLCRLGLALLGKVRGEDRDALVRLLVDLGAIGHAEQGLGSARAVVRARSAETLGAAGWRPALEGIVALLDDPDPDVRTTAARSLGRIGDPAAVAPLLAAIGRRRGLPSGIVAMALVRLGDAGALELRQGLGAPSPAERSVAAEVLGQLGDLGAVDDLILVLAADGSVEVRRRAAAALGRLGVPRTVTPLVACLRTSDAATVRAEAARSLGLVGAPAAAEALHAALVDPDHEVARAAATALVAVDPDGLGAIPADSPAGPPAAEAMAFAALAAAAHRSRRRVPARAAS